MLNYISNNWYIFLFIGLMFFMHRPSSKHGGGGCCGGGNHTKPNEDADKAKTL